MSANFIPAEFNEKFTEPTTLAECHERLFEVMFDIERIKMQLADRSRKDRMNLSDSQYGDWRKKASRARALKSRQAWALEQWVNSQKARQLIDSVSGGNHVAIIGGLVDAINDMRQKHHIPLNAEVHALITKADSLVSNFPAGR